MFLSLLIINCVLILLEATFKYVMFSFIFFIFVKVTFYTKLILNENFVFFNKYFGKCINETELSIFVKMIFLLFLKYSKLKIFTSRYKTINVYEKKYRQCNYY